MQRTWRCVNAIFACFLWLLFGMGNPVYASTGYWELVKTEYRIGNGDWDRPVDYTWSETDPGVKYARVVTTSRAVEMASTTVEGWSNEYPPMDLRGKFYWSAPPSRLGPTDLASIDVIMNIYSNENGGYFSSHSLHIARGGTLSKSHDFQITDPNICSYGTDSSNWPYAVFGSQDTQVAKYGCYSPASTTMTFAMQEGFGNGRAGQTQTFTVTVSAGTSAQERYTYAWREGNDPDPDPDPNGWKTGLGILNVGATAMTGVLHGLDVNGASIWNQSINLLAHGRIDLDVSSAAGSRANRIVSMRLDISSGQAVGYQKFLQSGKFRVGLEALPRANQNQLFVPHIASNNDWWTGIGWTNTTGSAKNLTFVFDTGQQIVKAVGAGSQEAFTIASLFGGAKQANIGAAQVQGGAGMVGLMLFGGVNSNILSGVNLSDAAATTLHFPHVAQDQQWWTGVVIYNPGSQTADLSLAYRDEQGNQLGGYTTQVGPGQKLVGTPGSLNFPAGTAWFSVSSTQPVTGFELFGTNNQQQLGGYSVIDLASTSGVFPALESNGWTGIAFVNIGAASASVQLEARNDNGTVVTSQSLSLTPGQKIVKVPENLFSGQSIAGATYIRFVSSQPVVGFQLNGSADETMLDAIPALGDAHAGAQQLYFPHIAAD
jgi:hypothetical protein